MASAARALACIRQAEAPPTRVYQPLLQLLWETDKYSGRFRHSCRDMPALHRDDGPCQGEAANVTAEPRFALTQTFSFRSLVPALVDTAPMSNSQ